MAVAESSPQAMAVAVSSRSMTWSTTFAMRSRQPKLLGSNMVCTCTKRGVQGMGEGGALQNS